MELAAALASGRKFRMGRRQIKDPKETTTSRFAKGTLDRARAVLEPKESIAGFVRTAVEALLTCRDRDRKLKP